MEKQQSFIIFAFLFSIFTKFSLFSSTSNLSANKDEIRGSREE